MPRSLQVSTANAAYQRIEVLKRNRTKRHRYGEFVVEGVRAINGALVADWAVRAFAYPRGRQLSRWASSILATSSAESHLEMDQSLFETLSEKDEPSELLAVVEMRTDTVERLPVRRGMMVVVVDRPASPGNLGTIIRSCDAFGASGVIVTGHGVDLYDPATIRASVGSFFAIPCIALPSHREVAAWVADARRSHAALRIVGTDEGGSRQLREYEWPSEAMIVVGNETSGLSHAYRELCDDIVSIPMTGTASSLNAAVATSIVLYEAASTRVSIQNEGQTETAGNC
jgi:23S rRNA (uridine2479-2'-O)-methyltransferase